MRVVGFMMALSLLATNAQAEEPYHPEDDQVTAETLLGCRTGTAGVTFVGWCQAHRFYGPLYVGTLAINYDRNASIYGIGQVGAVNVSDEWRGLMRIGLVNTSDFVVGGDIALVSYAEDLTMAQLAVVGVVEDHTLGVQLGAVVAYSGRLNGVQLGAVNLIGKEIEGVQLGAFNVAERVEGLQIGLVNYAGSLEGLQIGVFNSAMEGGLPFMILANAGF